MVEGNKQKIAMIGSPDSILGFSALGVETFGVLNLEDIKKKSKEDFLSNYNLYLSAQRALEVCINICIDIGNHIISLNENSKAETYAQIFEVLENMNIIPNKRKERLIQMVKFRDFLGHLYMDIDNEKVYEYISK